MEAAKRKAEDGEEGAAKRPKVDASNGSGASAAAAGPGVAAAAPRKLGIDLEKLQKAKLALQKQKELQEKLKKAGITVRGGYERGKPAGEEWRLAAAATFAPSSFFPDVWICGENLTPMYCCSNFVQLGKPGAAAAALRPPAAAPTPNAVAAAIAAGVPPAAAAAGIVPASLIAKGVTSVAAPVAAGPVPAAAAVAPADAAAPAGPKPVTKLPPPLILDDEGREIDPLTGQPIERRPEPQAQGLAAAAAQLQQELQKAEEDAAK